MQTLPTPDKRVTEDVASDPKSLLGFFIANNFLRCYERSDDVRAALFRGMDPTLLNQLTWVWIKNIAAVKPNKIRWPADDEWQTTFIVSLDGTRETQ